MNKNKFPLTPEMLASVLTNDLDADEAYIFENDPHGFVLQRLDLQTDIDIAVVSNQPNIVHLALPYYGSVERAVEALSPQDLEGASGGRLSHLFCPPDSEPHSVAENIMTRSKSK